MIEAFEKLEKRDPNINWDAFIPLIKNLQMKKPKQFNMEQWFDDLDQLDHKDDFCGTACCIAGWVWADDNKEIINKTYDEAGLLSQFDKELANSDIVEAIFERVHAKFPDWNLSTTESQVSEYARNKLGLTKDQGSQLFSCTYRLFDGYETNVWHLNRFEIGLDLGYDDNGDPVLPTLSNIEQEHAVRLLTGLFMGDLQFPQ